MSDWLAVLLAGLGILGTLSGVALGHYLKQRGEIKKEFEVAKVELYEGLFKVYVGVSLLMAVGDSLPPITDAECRDYRDQIHNQSSKILDLLLRNDIHESDSILRLIIEIRMRNYTDTVVKGLEVVIEKLEKSIKNQTYIKARKQMFEEDKITAEIRLKDIATGI